MPACRILSRSICSSSPSCLANAPSTAPSGTLAFFAVKTCSGGAAGPGRLLRGLVALDRGIPRAGMTVLDGAGGTPVGTVTSGTFSPTLEHGIALALLDAGSTALDTEVVVDVRGRPLRCRVVRPPFVEDRTKAEPGA